MEELKIIKRQLRKNMLLNLLAFGLIFSVLGIIIYSQFRISLYKSADEELLNVKNRVSIMNLANQDEKFNSHNGNFNERKTPPVLSRRDDENKVNPRLIYIFRDENLQIDASKSSGLVSDSFKNVDYDKNNIDNIYEVLIDGQYKYRAVNRKIQQEDKTIYLQILINVDAENAIVDSFRTNLIISIVTSMILSLIASYILSRKTLKPIILSWNKQTEFVQNASHELRTPLTIIQAKQELLLDEPQAKIIDKVEEINTSINETRRMGRLVRDLMQLAKADSNKIDIDRSMTAIDELINEVTKPFIEMAKVQNKTFVLNLKYGKLVNIDKSKIHQCLVTILDNSLKYTEKGDTITVETFERDSKCVINIKDTGIGISDEGLKHIFERFYREDKARSRETGGSGLGLSIASHIIELHGGSIKAMHNGNKGTIIEIKLK